MTAVFILYLKPVGLSTPNTTTSGDQYAGSSGDTTVTTPAGSGGQQTKTGDLLSLATTDGGTLQTKDFKNDPVTVKDPFNPGYFFIGNHFFEGISDPTATENPPYKIEYTDATQYFNIALLQEPVAATRQDAEQYLMSHLGISQSDMCRLKYMVSVPARINSFYSGRNLGFSFCPGATAL